MKISTTALAYTRESMGLRQTDLAAKAGISRPFLSQVEAGERDPSALVVKALADALGVTVDDLREPRVCPACGYPL